MSRQHDLTQHAAEEIGKRVHGIWGDHIVGTIVAGDINTGRWIVRSDDGTEREFAGCHLQEITPGESCCPDNAFTRNGISAGEFAEALVDAMTVGGADEGEIREAVVGVHVDAAMPDDGPAQLYRLQGPNAG